MNLRLCAGYATSAAGQEIVDTSRPRDEDTWQCLLCWIQDVLDVWGNVHAHVATSCERIAAPPRRRQSAHLCTCWHVACAPSRARSRVVRRGGFCISSDHCNCIISIVSFFFFFFGHCQACGISTVEHWFSFCQLFLAVLLVQEASMCARANRMCTHLSFLEKLTRD